jgi:uncharacterized protein YkvS
MRPVPKEKSYRVVRPCTRREEVYPCRMVQEMREYKDGVRGSLQKENENI